MPSKPGFKAHLGEWRTIIMALHYTRDHLTLAAPAVDNEEEQLIVYDHLERLDRLIPRMELELNEELSHDDLLTDSSPVYP